MEHVDGFEIKKNINREYEKLKVSIMRAVLVAEECMKNNPSRELSMIKTKLDEALLWLYYDGK